MPSFTEKQIESLTLKFNEIFGDDERVISAIDAVRSLGLKKKKEKKVREEGKMKRPSPASWLFREDKREFIIENIKDEMHFEDDEKKLAYKVPGKDVVKKAKELWDGMSMEDQKPWVDKNKSMWEEYYVATGGAKSSSPAKSPFNVVVPDEGSEVMEGWCGPYNGKHLLKFANGRKIGEGKFETLELALAAANKLKTCGGVTYKPKDGYTLRVGVDPVTHTDDSHISWTKENHTMKLPEKKQRKKVEKKEKVEEVKPEVTNDEKEEVGKKEEVEKVDSATNITESDNVYNYDTLDEDDDEDLEVTPWEHKGVTYLLDEKKGDVYDYDSQDLIGKKSKDKLMIFSGGK
jgi:hypothetical protein